MDLMEPILILVAYLNIAGVVGEIVWRADDDASVAVIGGMLWPATLILGVLYVCVMVGPWLMRYAERRRKPGHPPRMRVVR